jgi:hypothetical protein
MTQGLITIVCLLFSSYSFSQELTAALSLRLGPGAGFPTSIELPSNTDIIITQRRHSWLLVVDERGEGGWAKIAEVELAGGLADRQAWRLSELKEKYHGDLLGRWFSNEQGSGLSLGWASSFSLGKWAVEIEKSVDGQAEWHAMSAWHLFDNDINSASFYRIGLGLGYAMEDPESHVFGLQNQSNETLYSGAEFTLGYKPNQQMNTGVSVRYLLAVSQGNNDSTAVSWYWAFRI